MISFSQKLVRTPSASGEEDIVGELVAKKLDQIGLNVEVIGGNVLGRLEGTDSRTLALCGHLDTVPVTNPESWTVDPYGGQISDGKLWGVGSADMKAGLAAQIAAIDAFRRDAISSRGTVLFVATVMEEVGKRRLALRKGVIELLDKGLVKADAVVVGEPTDLVVARGHKGLCNIELTVHGKAAHASVPDKGVNAIEGMARILVALGTLKLGYHAELGPGTLTTCLVQGGTKLGTVPDVCRVSIDRRLTVGESKETVQQEIDDLLRSLGKDLPGLDVEIEYPYSYQSILTPLDNPVLKSIDVAGLAVTGKPATIGFAPFGTDGAWINRLTGCPIIIYGPGKIANAHAPNEYVELARVEEASKVYAALLGRYLSQG